MISIVIPTYNRAKRLAESVESVREQTYRDWDLIVVDDGSTDETADVVRGFGDARIKYIRQENRGVSAARNVGIRCSAGELVTFLDSDDRWEPRKLEVQHEFMNTNPDVHICQVEEIWIRNGRRVNPKKKHEKPSGWIFRQCLPLCVVSPSAVMLRRGVFDKVGFFDEDLPACEDYDLWLRASLLYEIVTIPQPLTIKIGGHEDQLSKQWGLDRWRAESLKKLLNNPALQEVHLSMIESELDRRLKIFAEGAGKRGRTV